MRANVSGKAGELGYSLGRARRSAEPGALGTLFGDRHSAAGVDPAEGPTDWDRPETYIFSLMNHLKDDDAA